MKQMARGIALGVAGIVLWFMPLVRVGINVYQTGNQVGNHITYLLAASSLAYAGFSCFKLHKLRIIAASIATGISLLFLIDAGPDATWNLYALIIVSGIGWIVGYTDGENDRKRVQDTRS